MQSGLITMFKSLRSRSFLFLMLAGGPSSAPAAVWVADSDGLSSGSAALLHNGEKFLAFSEGAISATKDGVLWRRTSASIPKFNDVVSTGTLYCGVGDGGRIGISTDGSQWEMMTLPTTANLRGVCAGAGRIVVVGTAGTIFESTDGRTWVSRSSGTTDNLNDIVYHDGKFIACGLNARLVRSSDGVNWTSGIISFYGMPFTRIVRGGQGFLMVGGWGSPDTGHAFFSTDGAAWTQTAEIPGAFRDIVYAAGSYVAISRNLIRTSADGINWTPRAAPQFSDLSAVAYGGGRFVVTGSGVDWPMTLTSTNGLDWGLDHDFRDLVVGPDKLVTVGASGAVRVSEEGRVWKTGQIGPYTFNSVAYGAGRYLAIAAQSSSSWVPYSSTDGLTWSSSTAVNATTRISGVCYGGGLFVAVGYFGSYIATSPDGINWTQRASPGIYFQSVTYGAAGFVAVGEAGQTAYSSDGVTWTNGGGVNTSYLWNVRFLNGRYWAAGDSGVVAHSETGSAWASVAIPTTNRVQSIAYGLGKYVAVDTAGRAFSSVDGASWREEFTGSTRSLKRVVATADSFLAISAQGSLLRQSRYGGWLAEHFPALADQKNSNLVEANSDPDGDGAGNLLEYALGTTPTQREHGSSFTLWVESGRLNYQYQRARADVDYTVETSTSLLPAEWSSNGVDQGAGALGTVTTASVPIETLSVFLRLNVKIK